ncbi:MAG: hypothetical protein ABIE46_00465 [Patescibacteria group bacterium]
METGVEELVKGTLLEEVLKIAKGGEFVDDLPEVDEKKEKVEGLMTIFEKGLWAYLEELKASKDDMQKEIDLLGGLMWNSIRRRHGKGNLGIRKNGVIVKIEEEIDSIMPRIILIGF